MRTEAPCLSLPEDQPLLLTASNTTGKVVSSLGPIKTARLWIVEHYQVKRSRRRQARRKRGRNSTSENPRVAVTRRRAGVVCPRGIERRLEPVARSTLLAVARVGELVGGVKERRALRHFAAPARACVDTNAPAVGEVTGGVDIVELDSSMPGDGPLAAAVLRRRARGCAWQGVRRTGTLLQRQHH